MANKKLGKWIFALRAGVVVSAIIITNAYLMMSELTIKNLFFGLASGFMWFLLECVRMYKIKLSPSITAKQQHGHYTMILGKVL